MPNYSTAFASAWDLVLLSACALFGAVAGLKLNLPAPTFLGPLIFSTLIHIGGISDAQPPEFVVSAAQVMLGSVLGCRFFGFGPRLIGCVLALSLSSTIASFSVVIAFAVVFEAFLGLPKLSSILALVPGGLSEMGLIALSLGADVNLVLLLHVSRTTMALVAARPIFAFVRTRSCR